MKKSDIALLIVIVAISLSVAYFAGRSIMSNYTQESVEVERVDTIKSGLEPVSADVFNEQAINPAVPINIGNSTNQQPIGQ